MKSIRDWQDEKFEKATGLDPNALRAITEMLGGDDEDSHDYESDIDRISLRKVMGGAQTQVSSALRNDLRPKIMQIIKDNPEDSPVKILRQILAVAGSLLGDFSTGGTISSDKIASKIRNP